MTYSEARERLAEVMDRAVRDHEEIRVTRRGHGAVVVVAEDEWRSTMETLHLMRSPANAAWLAESIEQAREGRTEVHELIEP